jgi:hypothetical protein
MAILTGAIKYRGSFKSIRNYVTLHDPNVYAGEKGGANKDQIMNNPVFARTRENMREFGGVGVAVKAIRRGLLNLLPEQTDKLFTSRLMKIVKEVNRRDYEGIRGKRAISFSSNQPLLNSIVFNKLEAIAESLINQFVHLHPITRATATLSLTDLTIKAELVPAGATHFRIQNHISIISDYAYVDINRRYETASPQNTISAFVYSEYTPIGTALTDELVAAFPVGTLPSDADTVIQCVGVEFYQLNGIANYSPLKGGSMLVIDAF